MTKQKQIYKCKVCGNIVEVLHAGEGTLICCGQKMEMEKEKLLDEGKEKHVPIIEKNGVSIKIKVGSVLHPMESSHYIEWIELIADGVVYRKFLTANDSPEAEFMVKAINIESRAYCNLHGLWKS